MEASHNLVEINGETLMDIGALTATNTNERDDSTNPTLKENSNQHENPSISTNKGDLDLKLSK